MSYPSQPPPPDRPPRTRWARGPDEPGGPRPASRRRRLAAGAGCVLAVAAAAGALAWGTGGGDRPGRGPRAATPHGAPPARSPSATARPGHGAGAGPLAGRTVLLDPGHNPHNRDHAAEIARPVDIGTARKECDTAGTATVSGYAEADFTLDLARRVRAALRRQGATVRLTQDGDRAFGPCVDERAAAGNAAHADAAVSLHADGAPAGNRGFHVILPASVRHGRADTTAVAAPSRRLGGALLAAFRRATGEPPAGYIADGRGLDVRSDLGGLNLSRVPKVFLECGNMRDPKDAARLTDPAWRQRAARGVASGISAYLTAEREK